MGNHSFGACFTTLEEILVYMESSQVLLQVIVHLLIIEGLGVVSNFRQF